MSRSAKTRDVVFALYDGMLLLDVSGPAEVFSTANMFGCDYRLHYVSMAGIVSPNAGMTLATTMVAQAPKTIHTLFVPGGKRSGINQARADSEFMSWLKRVVADAERVVSICTGAFLLGHVGLLDGRRATTHWASAKELSNTFPLAQIDGEHLFVEDGKVWTSAGAATGIEVALALVGRDAGPSVALKVARALVLHVVRPGTQSQFSVPLAFQARKGGELSRLVPWLEAQLNMKVSVADMAAAMGMSERTFYRHCMDEFEMPPARLLATLRLERARLLLNDRALPIGLIAHRVGFADAPSFSKAFAKQYGTPPSIYREPVFAHAGQMAFAENGQMT
tara:strand:- start:61877 stop:62884 length:1008 start_codon:yes stop_codon:yes gene_type:complete